jgi:phosphoglycolate phosphatase-like HAD superfamily hydrolase
MPLPLPQPPAAIIFDFDGVILDSTPLKSRAYFDLYADEDPKKLEEMERHERTHGGVTRRLKFAYYEKELFGRTGDPESVEKLAQRFSKIVFEKVVACRFIPGAEELLKKGHGKIEMHLVSGTPMDELPLILQRRDLTRYFKSVQGAPTLKPEAFANIMKNGGYDPARVIAVGDSRTECDVADSYGIPFLGIGVKGDYVFPDDAILIPTLEGADKLMGLD